MLTYLDLFAGAGGLSEGFLRAGYTPIAHVEMNPDACNTLRTRSSYYYLSQQGKLALYNDYLSGKISREALYHSVPEEVLSGVISQTMSVETMPLLFSKIDSLMNSQHTKSVDIIVGGPPCQAYSLVGRAVSSDSMKSDPRNFLYKVYIKALEKYSPRMFVFENVPGLLTANGGKYFAEIKEALSEAGYDLDYQILNAKDFGVLQNRLRVILIGWKKDSGKCYPSFPIRKSSYTVNDILSDLPPLQAGETKNEYRPGNFNKYLLDTGIRKQSDVLTWHCARPNIDRDREIYRYVVTAWDHEKKRIKYTDLPEELCTHNNRKAFLDRFKVVAADLPTSHTMMAHISKDGHYFIHPDIRQARSITVREAARIQSFPDDFFFEGSRTAAFTQIGNAVPPLMAKGIADGLKGQLEVQDERTLNQ